MKEETQDRALVPVKQDAEALIAQAIEKNVPVETMERLLVMRRELKAEYAKEQFDNAMSAFQAACPTITKTKSVFTKSGVKAYSYAPLEAIVAQVKELLKTYGFSYAVQTETLDGSVKATCIVKHRFGHSESSSIAVPLGNKTDIMSQTQVVAAALTFAKRYAFCNAFGILTGDEDTDANAETDHDNRGVRSVNNGSNASATAPFCQIHQKYMKQRKGKNGIWYDHRWTENGAWQQCNGLANPAEGDKEGEAIASDAAAALS